MILRTKTTRKNPNWGKELLSRLEAIRSRETAIGLPVGKGLDVPHYTSKRADGSTVAGPSILEVGMWANFETENSPARPFMDNAIPAIVSA